MRDTKPEKVPTVANVFETTAISPRVWLKWRSLSHHFTICNQLIFGLLLPYGLSAYAVNLSVLHNFSANPPGSYPMAPLIAGPDGTLYGTASGGPGSVQGTVSKIQPDGSGFTDLYFFTNQVSTKV